MEVNMSLTSQSSRQQRPNNLSSMISSSFKGMIRRKTRDDIPTHAHQPSPRVPHPNPYEFTETTFSLESPPSPNGRSPNDPYGRYNYNPNMTPNSSRNSYFKPYMSQPMLGLTRDDDDEFEQRSNSKYDGESSDPSEPSISSEHVPLRMGERVAKPEIANTKTSTPLSRTSPVMRSSLPMSTPAVLPPPTRLPPSIPMPIPVWPSTPAKPTNPASSSPYTASRNPKFSISNAFGNAKNSNISSVMVNGSIPGNGTSIDGLPNYNRDKDDDRQFQHARSQSHHHPIIGKRPKTPSNNPPRSRGDSLSSSTGGGVKSFAKSFIPRPLNNKLNLSDKEKERTNADPTANPDFDPDAKALSPIVASVAGIPSSQSFVLPAASQTSSHSRSESAPLPAAPPRRRPPPSRPPPPPPVQVADFVTSNYDPAASKNDDFNAVISDGIPSSSSSDTEAKPPPPPPPAIVHPPPISQYDVVDQDSTNERLSLLFRPTPPPKLTSSTSDGLVTLSSSSSLSELPHVATSSLSRASTFSFNPSSISTASTSTVSPSALPKPTGLERSKTIGAPRLSLPPPNHRFSLTIYNNNPSGISPILLPFPSINSNPPVASGSGDSRKGTKRRALNNMPALPLNGPGVAPSGNEPDVEEEDDEDDAEDEVDDDDDEDDDGESQNMNNSGYLDSRSSFSSGGSWRSNDSSYEAHHGDVSTDAQFFKTAFSSQPHSKASSSSLPRDLPAVPPVSISIVAPSPIIGNNTLSIPSSAFVVPPDEPSPTEPYYGDPSRPLSRRFSRTPHLPPVDTGPSKLFDLNLDLSFLDAPPLVPSKDNADKQGWRKGYRSGVDGIMSDRRTEDAGTTPIARNIRGTSWGGRDYFQQMGVPSKDVHRQSSLQITPELVPEEEQEVPEIEQHPESDEEVRTPRPGDDFRSMTPSMGINNSESSIRGEEDNKDNANNSAEANWEIGVHPPSNPYRNSATNAYPYGTLSRNTTVGHAPLSLGGPAGMRNSVAGMPSSINEARFYSPSSSHQQPFPNMDVKPNRFTIAPPPPMQHSVSHNPASGTPQPLPMLNKRLSRSMVDLHSALTKERVQEMVREDEEREEEDRRMKVKALRKSIRMSAAFRENDEFKVATPTTVGESTNTHSFVDLSENSLTRSASKVAPAIAQLYPDAFIIGEVEAGKAKESDGTPVLGRTTEDEQYMGLDRRISMAPAYDALFSNPLRRRRSMPTFTESTVPPPYPDFAPHPGLKNIRIHPREDEGRETLPPYSNAIYLRGVMPRKMEFSSPGVQAKDRKWRRVFCVLEGTAFKVYKPPYSSGVSAIGQWWESKVGVGDVALGAPTKTSAFHASQLASSSSASLEGGQNVVGLRAQIAAFEQLERASEVERERQLARSTKAGEGAPRGRVEPDLRTASPTLPQNTHHQVHSSSSHGVLPATRSALNLAVSFLKPGGTRHARSNSDVALSQVRRSLGPSLNVSQSGRTSPSSSWGSHSPAPVAYLRSSSPSIASQSNSRPSTPATSMRESQYSEDSLNSGFLRSNSNVSSTSSARGGSRPTTRPRRSTFGSSSRKGKEKETPDYQPNERDLMRCYTMQNAESGLGTDYLKRKNVIRIRLEGEQFLLQASGVENVIEWIESLQSASNIALDLDERSMPRGPIFPRRRRRRRAALAPINTAVASTVVADVTPNRSPTGLTPVSARQLAFPLTRSTAA